PSDLVRRRAVAQGRAQPLLEAPAPAAAAVDAGVPGLRGPRVGRVPALRPLPDVADDVVQVEGAGLEAADLAGAVVFPAGAPVRRRLPPWVRQLAIAPARGVLPLDLAREASAARRTVGRGLRMVDAVDGVLAARGASAVAGLSVA